MLAVLCSVRLNHNKRAIISLQWEVDTEHMITGLQESQDTFDLQWEN